MGAARASRAKAKGTRKAGRVAAQADPTIAKEMGKMRSPRRQTGEDLHNKHGDRECYDPALSPMPMAKPHREQTKKTS